MYPYAIDFFENDIIAFDADTKSICKYNKNENRTVCLYVNKDISKSPFYFNATKVGDCFYFLPSVGNEVFYYNINSGGEGIIALGNSRKEMIFLDAVLYDDRLFVLPYRNQNTIYEVNKDNSVTDININYDGREHFWTSSFLDKDVIRIHDKKKNMILSYYINKNRYDIYEGPNTDKNLIWFENKHEKYLASEDLMDVWKYDNSGFKKRNAFSELKGKDVSFLIGSNRAGIWVLSNENKKMFFYSSNFEQQKEYSIKCINSEKKQIYVSCYKYDDFLVFKGRKNTELIIIEGDAYNSFFVPEPKDVLKKWIDRIVNE